MQTYFSSTTSSETKGGLGKSSIGNFQNDGEVLTGPELSIFQWQPSYSRITFIGKGHGTLCQELFAGC